MRVWSGRNRLLLLGSGFLLAIKVLIPVFGVLTPDGARDLAQAWKVTTGEWVIAGPLIGNTLHLGPGYFYLLALPLALGGSATAALCFLSLCTLPGVFFAYRIGTLLFDREVGLAFAVLFAGDYWGAFCSMSIASIDLLPVVSLGFIWGVCHCAFRHHAGGLVWALVWGSLAFHIHPVAIALFPLLLFAWQARASQTRAVIIGLMLAAVIVLPWVMQVGGSDAGLSRLWQGFSSPGEGLGQWFAVLPDLLGQFWSMGPTLAHFWSQAVEPPGLRNGLLLVQETAPYLALGGAGVLIVEGVVRKHFRPLTFILVWCGAFWLVFPPLLSLARAGYGVPHKLASWYYYYPLQPLLPLLVALLGVLVPRWCLPEQSARLVTGTLVPGLAVASALLSVGSFQTLAARGVVEDQAYPYLPAMRLPYVSTLHEEALTRQVQHWAKNGRIGVTQLHGLPLISYLQNRGIVFQIHGLAVDEEQHGDFHIVGFRRDDLPGTPKGEDRHDVGPFVVLQYRSPLVYHSLRFSTQPEPAWTHVEFNDARWPKVTLPSLVQLPQLGVYPPVPDMVWEEEPIYVRGTFLREKGETLVAGVTFPAADVGRHQGRLCGLFVNGKKVERVGEGSPYLQLFRLPAAVPEGQNVIALCAQGSRHMVLDLFMLALE